MLQEARKCDDTLKQTDFYSDRAAQAVRAYAYK